MKTDRNVLAISLRAVSCKYVCNALCCQSTAGLVALQISEWKEKTVVVHIIGALHEPTLEQKCCEILTKSHHRTFLLVGPTMRVVRWATQLELCKLNERTKESSACDNFPSRLELTTYSHSRADKLQLQLIIFFASSTCNVSWSLGSEIQFL